MFENFTKKELYMLFSYIDIDQRDPMYKEACKLKSKLTKEEKRAFVKIRSKIRLIKVIEKKKQLE